MAADPTTYARALLAVSADHRRTLAELGQLVDVLEQVPQLSQVLVDAASRDQVARDRIVNTVLHDVTPLYRNLLVELAADGTLPELPAVVDRFRQLYKQQASAVSVVIETPATLSDAQRARIVREVVPAGATPLVSEVIRPQLIGGLRVIVDDVEHDLSVGGALGRLSRQMAGSH